MVDFNSHTGSEVFVNIYVYLFTFLFCRYEIYNSLSELTRVVYGCVSVCVCVCVCFYVCLSACVCLSGFACARESNCVK